MCYQILCETKQYYRDKLQFICGFPLPAAILIICNMLLRNTYMGGERYVEYIFPGCIALIIMTTSFFALCTPLVKYKEMRVDLLYCVLPHGTLKIVLAITLSRVLILLLQLAMLLFISIFFKINVHRITWGVSVACFFSMICFFVYAIMIASIVNKTRIALTIANSMYIGLTFISGTFFPTANFPEPILLISRIFPFYHIVELIRGAWISEMADVANHIVVLAVWALFCLSLSIIIHILKKEKKNYGCKNT